MDIDAKVTTFASTLFEKVPRTSANASEKRRQDNRAREKEALESQNKRYALVDSDEEETSLKIQPKKVKKSKKNKRKKVESDQESENEFDKVCHIQTPVIIST